MGDGLQDDPVVEELILLACDVQLWQLKAPLCTHILASSQWGSWLLGPEGDGPYPTQAPEKETCTEKEEARPRAAHLLKEPDIEDQEGAV